jgi:type III secretion system low calcium response chaperone LcrH/SycD
MKSEQHQIKKAADKISAELGPENKDYQQAVDKLVKKGVMPKDVMGLSDSMIEGIYAQAYRLYNTGKYKDAAQLFRLLIMLNSTEAKYAMGLAACFHMMKEFKNAVEMYALCAIIDPTSPVPHFHSSDCYIQMKDPISALIALEMAVKRAGNQPTYQTLRDRSLLTIESLKKEMQKPKE